MHVIGTAGHVDHGKSSLVHKLTGIDPDRLAEEKAREMTIDLGFAWLDLDGEEVGIVDVPGHRDFIENMLAGVGGIDLALLVIAADEGVMPQTREHLAILDLLQVKRGVVALTKIDLIDDPDWLELVSLEIADTLRGTALAEAPIVPVSARTATGLDALKARLSDSLREIGESLDWGRPRLPIDRVFTLPGFGTVVTGTLLDGSLRVGEAVEIQPGGLMGRIRGLQTHKTKRETARPGSRVAINLAGIDHDQLRRGQVVAAPGVVRGTYLLDATYRHLADNDAPLLHHEQVKLFTGAAEVLARGRIIGQETIAPGAEGWIQLALEAPVAAARGDRYILRRPSPGTTLGGGQVLDPHPGRRHRRFKPEAVERFRALSQGTNDEIILRTLLQLGPVSQATLLEKSGLPRPEGQAALQSLLESEEAVAVGKNVITASAWRSLQERLLQELALFHQATPLRRGMEREVLRARLKLPVLIYNSLCEFLNESGQITAEGTTLRLPTHMVTFSPSQQAAIDRLMAWFAAQGALSPSVKECQTIVGEPAYYALVDLGRIQPIAEDVVYDQATYERLLSQLTAYLQAHGAITPIEAKEELGISRKYAIALLEHMDALRLTRREGDRRVLTRPRSG